MRLLTDILFTDHGLPPYYPDLNPTEKIWSTVKGRTAAKNVAFKLQDVQQLAEENFTDVTKEK
jgi:hypothetical protein